MVNGAKMGGLDHVDHLLNCGFWVEKRVANWDHQLECLERCETFHSNRATFIFVQCCEKMTGGGCPKKSCDSVHVSA